MSRFQETRQLYAFVFAQFRTESASRLPGIAPGHCKRGDPRGDESLAMKADLDAIDWKILRELQNDGRITNVEL